MRISILGWGSLIWDPRNLEIDKTKGQNGWLPDGPKLPIEFSRISQDGRLTLVIDPKGVDVQTLYSISKYTELDHAILNLAVREGSGRHRIGYYCKIKNELRPSNFEFERAIKSWINDKANVDAVIWTNLVSKLWYINTDGDKINVPTNELTEYLRKMPLCKQAVEEEYIRKTPISVITPVRNLIEEQLGWNVIV